MTTVNCGGKHIPYAEWRKRELKKLAIKEMLLGPEAVSTERRNMESIEKLMNHNTGRGAEIL